MKRQINQVRNEHTDRCCHHRVSAVGNDTNTTCTRSKFGYFAPPPPSSPSSQLQFISNRSCRRHARSPITQMWIFALLIFLLIRNEVFLLYLPFFLFIFSIRIGTSQRDATKVGDANEDKKMELCRRRRRRRCCCCRCCRTSMKFFLLWSSVNRSDCSILTLLCVWAQG